MWSTDELASQELTKEAKIVNVRFTKSVIASKEAFTYEAAQLRKDNPYVFLHSSSHDNHFSTHFNP